MEVSAYPNPFAQSTTVEISGTESVDAQVNVYNMNGQLVTTLYNGPMSAGSHYRFTFSPETESGVYFITVTTTEGEVQTIRVANVR